MAIFIICVVYFCLLSGISYNKIIFMNKTSPLKPEFENCKKYCLNKNVKQFNATEIINRERCNAYLVTSHKMSFWISSI